MDRNERSEEDASRLSSPRIYPSRPETKRMTCASNSGIEVSEMRGRRAAFIYPARSDTRILRLLHSPPPPPLHRAFHPSSLPSLSSSSSSYRAHSVDLLFPSLLSVFFIDRQGGLVGPSSSHRFLFSPSLPPRSVSSTPRPLSASTPRALCPHCCLSFLLSSVNFVFRGREGGGEGEG